MNPLMWIGWSACCALGSGVLVFFVMQSRMELLLAKQREEMAAAKATIEAHKDHLEQSLKHSEDTARRKALDEFLADIRVEERHYTREHKKLFLTRRSLIRQERIFFRNIPLSNWVEHEMPLEEGADVESLAQTMAIFAGEFMPLPTLPGSTEGRRRLLGT